MKPPKSSGSFAAKVDYGTGVGPVSVTLGDFSGDGNADVAVANTYTDTVSVLLNNGNGTFAARVDYVTERFNLVLPHFL